MVKFAVGPCQVVSAWLHGSRLLPELEGDCGVNVGKPLLGRVTPGKGGSGVLIVGKGGGVSVGSGVGLAVSVGIGVLVGNAC